MSEDRQRKRSMSISDRNQQMSDRSHMEDMSSTGGAMCDTSQCAGRRQSGAEQMPIAGSDAAGNERRLYALQQENAQLRGELQRLCCVAKDCEAEKARCTKLRQRLQQTEECLEQAQDAMRQMEERLAQQEDALQNTQLKLAKACEAVKDCGAMRDELARTNEALCKMREQLEDTMACADDLRSKLCSANGVIENLRTQLDHANTNIATLRAQLENANACIEHLRQLLEECRAEVCALRAELCAARCKGAELCKESLCVLQELYNAMCALREREQEMQRKIMELSGTLERVRCTVNQPPPKDQCAVCCAGNSKESDESMALLQRLEQLQEAYCESATNWSQQQR